MQVHPSLAVGVFPSQRASFEVDDSPNDVVSEPEAAHPQPVLAFASRNTLKFLDGVRMADIQRISGQDFERPGVLAHEFRMTLGEFAKLPIEMGRGLDGKRRHHALRRLRRVLLVLSFRNSASNSSAERVLPALMSALLCSIRRRTLGSCNSR